MEWLCVLDLSINLKLDTKRAKIRTFWVQLGRHVYVIELVSEVTEACRATEDPSLLWLSRSNREFYGHDIVSAHASSG